MARVAGGDAGELAVDARAGAARPDPGRNLAALPGPAPAGADCRPRPARTKRLRSVAVTNWARGGMSLRFKLSLSLCVFAGGWLVLAVGWSPGFRAVLRAFRAARAGSSGFARVGAGGGSGPGTAGAGGEP